MGGGASKQSDEAKKFQTTSTVTVERLKVGEDGEKSTTVGGSKKLYLIIGDVKIPEELPRQKISPFGRQTGLAVGCKIDKSGGNFKDPLFEGYECVPFEICDNSGTIRVEPNLKAHSSSARQWFFPEGHRENYITFDANSFQVKSCAEVGGDVKVRADAYSMFEKHGCDSKAWGKIPSQSERAELIAKDKGWAASESYLKVGDKVAIVGTKFVEKKTYDVVLVPILMTTLAELCPALKDAGNGRSSSFSDNDLAEKEDLETESMVCDTERD
mmetsp:Transcript_5935/g.10828  ORF Transcript_5935/g.10828 Transcript_5935/m.10828 type:complete len:271 (+) Transcript_5935:66-878(+)|eukprot:CAMPEP_0182493282 /NCGR_PEP_ID=MMETSP1321-20130603/2260_1 /TAXON_ID=91990 /ORGANISM="Bolidomonas sp., Strain RCC1657" /LENGTH=270 /DNA_ID=CAMNT_0024695999 /DNA_START=54 /DNA_END=866 /DNA_ORIENTATION=-